jgi:hypothetical protein
VHQHQQDSTKTAAAAAGSSQLCAFLSFIDSKLLSTTHPSEHLAAFTQQQPSNSQGKHPAPQQQQQQRQSVTMSRERLEPAAISPLGELRSHYST